MQISKICVSWKFRTAEQNLLANFIEFIKKNYNFNKKKIYTIF